MLRKLVATLTLVLAFNSMANAPLSQVEALTNAYAELNYALEVEWDQQDKKFHAEKVAEFKKRIEKLQEAGLSNAELIEFAKRNVNDKKLASNMDSLFETVSASEMTAAEARDFAIKFAGKNSSQGASWRGSAGTVALVVALVLIIALAATADTVYVGGGGYYDCYDDYVCYDYYDDWYGYWYTDCYWETYCY